MHVGYNCSLNLHHALSVIPDLGTGVATIWSSPQRKDSSIIWRDLWVVCSLYSTTSQVTEYRYTINDPLSNSLSYKSFLQGSCWSSPLPMSGINSQRGHMCTPEPKTGLFTFPGWPQKCLCVLSKTALDKQFLTGKELQQLIWKAKQNKYDVSINPALVPFAFCPPAISNFGWQCFLWESRKNMQFPAAPAAVMNFL